MIPAIQEIGFGPGTAKSYATLHQATVSLQEMGERTISTQVRIDGDVVPDFTGWELVFKGERFILPTTVPQAAKDDRTRNSLVDLNFTSWIISELKRYYFVSLSQIDANTAIADKYKASVILPIRQFVELFNRVLKYYFGDQVRMDLFNAEYSSDPVSVEINYTHIWDVLQKFYELFEVRWNIVVENGVYVIKVGFAADSIEDHDFEYGYQGGLLKFERQVQDENITNILLGRGGEKNLPYRYFKLQDPQNPEWEADPDAIPELANVYFDRLRDAAFRWYVRGWMQNPNRDTSWDATHTFPTYDDVPEEYQYAYNLGRTDEKFNPVEFVKDDASVEKYGERWGAQDDNDDIYPTIQGVKRDPIGRVDQVVDVSEIATDDTDAAAAAAAVETNVQGATLSDYLPTNTQHTDMTHYELDIRGHDFAVPEGQVANFDKSGAWALLFNHTKTSHPVFQKTEVVNLTQKQKDYLSQAIQVNTDRSAIHVFNKSTGSEVAANGIPAGDYYYTLHVYLNIDMDMILNSDAWDIPYVLMQNMQINVTAGTGGMIMTYASADADSWKPTFDIWVKNIWNTEKAQGESDAAYAARVWEKILGDRVGNEAKIVFSDGFMSISEDYEFQIASYPVFDQSKSITVLEDGEYKTYQSEWKITLRKSDADFDATGKYVPSADGGKPAAGDHFFFTGIDMPFSYVEWAEETLHASKKSALDGLADIQPTWVITLDKVRVHTIEDADYGRALADRLAAGATVWIKDRRFTGNARLKLYVQSITYTWNEPEDVATYLVPDIEVVLSDKVVDVEGPVAQIQSSVENIRTTYARAADVESIVRRVAEPLFLKKTGEADSSVSPTQFASKVTSKSFRQGDVGGRGWGFYMDTVKTATSAVTTRAAVNAEPDENSGDTVLEIDKVVVRKEMRVNSLVVNQVAYVGGRQIISAAAIECTQVVDDPAGYYCYFNQKQGSVANLFQVGDFAMGQVFDPTNSELKYYRARVDEVGVNYILLSKTVVDGEGVPAEGDVIVQYGHESNASRQYVIVRDVIGGGYERMLSGLDSVDADGDEYYFAGRQSGQNPRWFVGDIAGEYAEWVNGRLNIKGTLIVRNSDGTYQAMTDYMSSVASAMDALQAQIDGQIQSWSSGEAPSEQTEPFPQVVDDVVDPSTANFPASGWTLSADREKHFGDIYVDDSTGQGYRYTKRLKNGVTEYYWTRITDEEVAEAMRLAQLANQGVAGLQYLKQATNGGTLISGGLVLTSMIQLGQAADGGAYNVWAGINGTIDDQLTNPLRSIAAWYGGPMVDHEADPTAASYAKSLFRMDGSGYLAGGNIHWDQSGYGGIPGITWNGSDIIIGGNVKLASLTGDSVTELIGLVRELSSLIEKVNIGTQANPVYAVHVKDGMGFYSDSFVDAGGVGSGGGGGGADLLSVWVSLKNNDDDYADWLINAHHIPIGNGLVINSQTGLIDVTVRGGVTSVAGMTGDISTAQLATALGIANLDNNLATISDCLKSLQSQVDSVASRDMFDELSATSLYADIAVAQSLYADSISLDGNDLSTKLNTLVPKTTTVNGHALSGNISLTKSDVGLSNVENTALSTWAGTGNITTLGTITTGVWHGTPIANDYLANKTIGVGGATITLGSSATLTQIGIPAWAQKASLAFADMPAMYIGNAMVQSSAQTAQNIGGLGTVTASGLIKTTNYLQGVRLILADGVYLEYDSSSQGVKLVGAGFWTESYVTAGGVGSGGGGGGGGDLDVNTMYINLANGEGADPLYFTREINVSHLHEFWKSLQNNDIVSTYDNYKIAGAHIPDMAETYGYLKSADIDAYLQSLQSQIDSVAARTNFDDLVVTSLFSDVASISSLYAETIYLGGTSIASSLSSLASRATALEGRADSLEDKFDANGNAKSALKLTTVSKTIWGQTYWTSGGVPQNVTDAPNLYIGGSKVQTSQSAQALVGISSISAVVSPGSDDETKIEWDANANAWHFHGGIYADTFVTAGGVGSGGSVPTTLDAVWNTLRYNTGDYQDVQIDLAHIPGLPWSKIISGKPSSLSGYGILDAYTKTEVDNLIGAIDQFHYEIYPSLSDITTPAGNVLYLIGPTGSGSDKYEEYVYANGTFTKIGDTTIDLSAYLTIASAQATYQPIITNLATIETQAGHGETAYNSLDTISNCLQSLQGQIDSVATRNDFDELNASSVFSDIVAATSIYAGSIALGGNDLATTLSNLSGRIGTVEGKFTGDSANSALRLAGTSAYSIWGVEYWSSGVPKSVTGRPGLFIGSTQVQTSAATQDLAGIGSITATGALTLSSTKKIYFGDSAHYIELDSNGYFHFSHGLYSDAFVTAGGQGTGGGGGGGLVEQIYRIGNFGDTFDTNANDTFNAYAINSLHLRIASLEQDHGVTYVGLSMPTGFSVSSSPITASGTLSVSFASGYSLLTSTQISTWNGKQDAIRDLDTIRTNATNGATAYGWGNHANAGYFAASSFTASNIVSTLGNTAVNRATADTAGENIASNFTTVGNAIKSLQSQIDSVASRSVYDELTATNLYSDMAVGVSAYFSNFYGNLTGTASNATNADNADKLDGVHASGLFTELTTSAGSTNLYITIGGTRLSKTVYAYYDSDGGVIASNMTTIGTALRSLQSQIDSVATNRSFDEISITSAFVDMLSVGSNVNVGGTIHSIGGIDSNSYITAGATGSSSDARLKDNIVEVSTARALQLLSALKGKEWTWNNKKEYLAGKHGSGLIAQEVLPVMPWAVLDLNGEYSLNYNTLWGVAIPVMQSHEQRIEALERENKELKHKIEMLTNNS